MMRARLPDIPPNTPHVMLLVPVVLPTQFRHHPRACSISCFTGFHVQCFLTFIIKGRVPIRVNHNEVGAGVPGAFKGLLHPRNLPLRGYHIVCHIMLKGALHQWRDACFERLIRHHPTRIQKLQHLLLPLYRCCAIRGDNGGGCECSHAVMLFESRCHRGPHPS